MYDKIHTTTGNWVQFGEGDISSDFRHVKHRCPKMILVI